MFFLFIDIYCDLTMDAFLEFMKFFLMLFHVVNIKGEIAFGTTFKIPAAVSQM